MPVSPTYPGVYVEEVPSSVRTITGVATSIAAFIGAASRGPTTVPVRIQSFADFERKYGGLSRNQPLGYAVQQFFQNGGTDAQIVRVVHIDEDESKSAKPAELEYEGLKLVASSEGSWGDGLKIIVAHPDPDDDNTVFNLRVKDDASGQSESFLNLSTDPTNPRYVLDVLRDQSELVRATEAAGRPSAHPAASDGKDPFEESGKHSAVTKPGADGDKLTGPDVEGKTVDDDQSDGVIKTGLHALDHADLFNLLCIPPLSREPGDDVPKSTLGKAANYCSDRRAMLIVDPRGEWTNVTKAEKGVRSELNEIAHKKNAALFFPRIRVADPLKENRLDEFAPCGAIAGMYARTDTNRGIWKAPAGQNDGRLSGVSELGLQLTDGDNGRLNPLGLNCLRTFPIFGNVVWGARTADGADQAASQWKYVPVRRTALFIEESLRRGLGWVVMEPNDEPLWAQIRLNVGAFMHNLFTQGAFQGQSPADSYFVRCDADTTTQIHIDLGIVNVHVGFAPLKPAEFVIIKLEQIAGQMQA
ncbi:MAG: phage tail sheath C-terminal domain-containing protein [Planctomycetota bacterium]